MIEGLKIDIASDELSAHLNDRAAHHAEKAKWYDGQIASLSAGREETYQVSNDPISSLKSSEKSHTDRAGYFAFLAKHLVDDEVYRLTESDFRQLELTGMYL